MEDFGDQTGGGDAEMEDSNDEEERDPALPLAVLEYVAQINDERLWKVVEGELSTFRQGTNGRTMLHHAAHLGNMALLQRLMARRVNPFIPSRRCNLAIDVAANPEMRAALANYMKWDPKKPGMLEWYGPLVYQRALCFLLVLLRYNMSRRMPRDIRLMILNMIVANEVVYLKRNPPLQEFRQ